jgi:hypothetical protein
MTPLPQDNRPKPITRVQCVLVGANDCNAAGANGLTCLPKHGGARDSKFLVTYPKTNQRCLTSAIARRNALTAGPLSSSPFSYTSTTTDSWSVPFLSLVYRILFYFFINASRLSVFALLRFLHSLFLLILLLFSKVLAYLSTAQKVAGSFPA